MRRFDIGVNLVIPLISLLAVWLVWSIWNKKYKALILPTLAIFAYPLSIEICVSMASILAAVGSLYQNNKSLSKFLALVFAFLSGIEALALFHWLYLVPLGLTRPFRAVAKFEMGLFYIAAHLAPFLSLPLMYMWLLKHMIERNWSIRIHLLISKSKNKIKIPYMALLFFLFTIFISVVAALYPYNNNVNPQQRVGSDVQDYITTAKAIETNFTEISTGMSSSRPIVFLFITGYQRLLGTNTVTAVKLLPLLLNPLLCVSVAFLTLETFNDWWIASWASFFTICGYHVSVGLYAFFLSNMLGLCFSFFSLGFLFRALRNEHNVSLLVAGLLGALLCFTHPWTFDQHVFPVIAIGGFLWYLVIKYKYNYRKVKMILYYLMIIGLAELLKSKVWGGYGGIKASVKATNYFVGLSDFWRNNIFTFRILFGGLLSVIVLLFLAILGIYLLGHYSIPRLYFTILLIASSLVYLIGDSTIKSRLLYNMPIGLFAAYGLNWILKQKIIDDYKHVFASFVVLNLVVYLFRSLANIV
ncbi:MAG: hypothetical protein ACFFDN_00590 [Candidatus Hodarchaeota archaeon]